MKINPLYKKSVQRLKGAGIKSAEIDTKILLQKATGLSDAFILTYPEYDLNQKQLLKFRQMLSRRLRGEPIAYITKEKEFFGLKFFVNKNVLIPRPETEELVEEAREMIKKYNPKSVIDIGTGSGNIIIALWKNFDSNNDKNVALYAVDNSRKALWIAKRNAEQILGRHDIKFLCSDLFSNRLLPHHFDLIIANLPYVLEIDQKTALENNEEVRFEPAAAIYAPEKGSQIIKLFLNQAKEKLANRGVILIELDPRNGKKLEKYAQKIFSDNFRIELKKDLSGRIRFLTIQSSTHSSI